jgi:ring-1,2-phenylacetyl-CoA epoxidase subunit PaaD
VTAVTRIPTLEELRAAAASVPDPEMPMLTIEDLGVLRDVRASDDGAVEIDLTPTYSGCPAMESIRTDVEDAVRAAGASSAVVRIVLAPAWSTDDISDLGRHKLREHGIAPPSRHGPPAGPVPVGLSRRTPQGPVAADLASRGPATVPCPRCGSASTREVSRFGPTACTALWACASCLEPFEQVKRL